MELAQIVWVLLAVALAGYSLRVVRTLGDDDHGTADLTRPALPRLLQDAAPLEDVGQAGDLRRAEAAAELRRAA